MSSPGGRTARRHPRCVRKWRASVGQGPPLPRGPGAAPGVQRVDPHDSRGATRSTPREITRPTLLTGVRGHQPISRRDLARRMALGRGMVTILVNELLEEGALYGGALAELPRGRRPKMLHVETRDRLVVAIDVRFSRTDVLLSDLGGKQIALERFATRFGPEELLDELAIRVRRLLRTHAARRRCQGIGMVIPGMVDRGSGRVLNAPQLGWRDVQVRAGLAARTGLAVHVENAPAACALAHIWLSERANGIRDFVYVSVSDGVGTGVVGNGEVVRGHAHTAGGVRPTPLSADGPHCLCGSQGCLEAHTSNLATVARYLGHELSPAIARELLQQSGVTVDDVVRRAGEGDERARAALADTGRYLGMGISMIVQALNPAQIVVGGEITGAWNVVEPAIRAEVAMRALTPRAAETPMIPEPAGRMPRLLGAIALVAAPAYAAPQVG